MGANFNGALGGVNPNSTPVNGVNYDGFNSSLLNPTRDNFSTGGNGTGMSVGQSFNQMQTGGMMPANPTNVAPQYNSVEDLYKNILNRQSDAGGAQYWQQQFGDTIDPNEVAAFQAAAQPELQQKQQQLQQQQQQARLSQNPYGITGANTNSLVNSTNPYIQAAQQTTLGNYQGAQQATTANRVNQQTPYANLNYEQTGTDANGNPIWTAKQTLAGPLQGALGSLQQRVAGQSAQGFNPNTPGVGINPGELYSDAIMRRLQPQLQQQSAAVETQLANQGIMPGSEAYNRAKTQLAQQQNDALTSAQVGGINVGLQANQQSFNQQLQQANLPFQQLGAFQQATQPGYVNPYNQATVAGPDYTGAYTTSQAAQIAAQNAANAKTANLQSGLFGLGSSAILGAGGVGNLVGGGLSALGSGYNWLDNLVTRNSNQALPDFVGPIF
jgi:hypothetical protein